MWHIGIKYGPILGILSYLKVAGIFAKVNLAYDDTVLLGAYISSSIGLLVLSESWDIFGWWPVTINLIFHNV